MNTSLDSTAPLDSAPTPLWRLAVTLGLSILIFLGVIVGLSLLLGLWSVNVWGWAQQVDDWLYRGLAGSANGGVRDTFLTLLNDPGLDYSVVVAACLGFVWWRKRRELPLAVAAVLLTLIVGAWTMGFTSQFGFRPRPFLTLTDVQVVDFWRQVWAGLPSFPSGHIRELTGLCVVLGYFWPKARPLAVAYIVLVAISRVYVGAHFPSDVVAGVLIGALAGSFAVFTVDRVRGLVQSLNQTSGARSLFVFLRGPRSVAEWQLEKVGNRALRGAMYFVLLLALGGILGYVLHLEHPRVLADYLRNTDNSLVSPLLSRFDSGAGTAVYWLLLNGAVVYPVLALLTMGRALWEHRGGSETRLDGRAMVRGGGAEGTPIALGLHLLLSLAVVGVLGYALGHFFERLRPFLALELGLPGNWPAVFGETTGFPELHLTIVMALCTVLALAWPRARLWAYLFPLFVAVGLVFFGAAWPTDIIGSLVIGFLAARYAGLLIRQVEGEG